MNKCISAEWLMNYFAEDADYYGPDVRFDIENNMPSIDIVHCRECKKRDDDYVCYKWASVDECPRVRPNDFCSYGEREGE